MALFAPHPHVRRFALCLILLAFGLPATRARAQITGIEVPELQHYDTRISDFIARRGIPGAAVAVSKDGRLIYARGFGYADTDAGTFVQPDSRFRIASISKPITAVAVMKLVEEGRLTLHQPAFELLPDLPAAPGAEEDPRLAQITVRDLLQHSGGWDRDGTRYDPMFDAVNIAQAMGVAPPADCETVIRYMRGRTLDFDPGTGYSYSNFGYCVLGRIIERVTGESYDTYVRGLLAEAGIEQMELGRSLLEDRLPGEVRYYPETPANSVFDGSAASWPYGGFHIEAMDAHGGWVASAVDLLRFTAALDGLPERPDLLSASSMEEMTIKPGMQVWMASGWWYALGWQVNTNRHWWHNGSLPGLETLLVRSAYNGLHWAVLLNHRPEDGSSHIGLVDGLMWELALDVASWPEHDLFEQYVATEALPRPVEGFELSAPYPNPAHDRASVQLSLSTPAHVRLELFDVLGRSVGCVLDGPQPAGIATVELPTDELRPGLYVVRAATDAGDAVSSRFVVVR